jgi:hypothetical protein
MSQLEVDKVIPQSGTTLTLGESGDTVSVPSGATLDASNATLTLPDDSVTTAKIDDGAVTSAKITYPLTTFSSTGIDDDGTSTAITINSDNNVALAGNIGLGGATPTTSGTGITFPATASASTDANTLDDYEEGTWTPSLSITSGTITLSSTNGSYTKIGRVVYLTAFLVVTSVGSPSGELRIQSIPFTPKNENANSSALAMSYFSWTAGAYFVNGEIGTASNQINVYSNNNGARSDAAGFIQAGSQFHVSGFYYIA